MTKTIVDGKKYNVFYDPWDPSADYNGNVWELEEDAE